MYHARISFSHNGEIILEFDSSNQNNQSGELNNPSTSFICPISDDTGADSGNPDHLSLLIQLPPPLWAKSPTGVGKIHSASPIDIQVDLSKPLPRINQYSISKDALQIIKLITEDYRDQHLIITLLFYP